MLMGCRKLLKVEGYKTIIEGDSVFAIQWGLGKVKCPWRLTNRIEEVHMIVRRLQCSYNDVLRNGNDLADGLAREGVLSCFCWALIFFLPLLWFSSLLFVVLLISSTSVLIFASSEFFFPIIYISHV